MAQDKDKQGKQPEADKPKRRLRRRGAEAEAAAKPAEEKPKRARARRPAKAQTPDPKAGAGEAGATPARRTRAAASADKDKPADKPAPRRGAARPSGEAPVVRAQARYVRSSARKARLVCDHIRGKSVEDARAILAYAPRAVARDWSKVLESAVANAEHNHELVGDELRVREAYADEGPTLKRYRPRAMGRATPIRKRTTHLTIALTPKESD